MSREWEFDPEPDERKEQIIAAVAYAIAHPDRLDGPYHPIEDVWTASRLDNTEPTRILARDDNGVVWVVAVEPLALP